MRKPDRDAFPVVSRSLLVMEDLKSQYGLTWVDLSVIFLIMSVMIKWLALTPADPDLWGHVRFGQDILQSGHIIQKDPYSYLTGDQPWINHEWLAEVVFAALFTIGGSEALILFKIGVGLLMVTLLYWNLGTQGLSAVKGGIVLLASFSLLYFGLEVLRPQIFTYLFLVCTLLLLDAADRGELLWLFGIPPIFALWVNLHGGFLAGLGVLALWSVARTAISLHRSFREGWRARRSDMAFLTATFAAVIATFANPFGTRLVYFLFRTATIPRPDIIEWQPIQIASRFGIIYLVLLVFAILILISTTRERRLGPLLVFFCLAALPLLASRHIPIFGLGLSILIGEHINDVWNRPAAGSRAGQPKRKVGQTNVWFAGLAIIVGIASLWSSHSRLGCIPVYWFSGYDVPARAVALLRKGEVSGNMAVFFNWGEYAIWHLGPQIRISIDGRRETVYSDKAQAENLRFLRGVDDWDTLIQQNDTQLVLVPKKYAVFNLLKLSPGWVLAYEDSVSGIFARQDSPLVGRIRETSSESIPDNGNGLCFP